VTRSIPDEIGAVCEALRRSHRELASFAMTIPPAERTRRSYCTEWTVAQVYSHLGSGAEIESARIRAGLAGTAAPDPTEFWRRWDALRPDQMIEQFAAADAGYLDLVHELNLDEVGDVAIVLEPHLRVPLRTAIVLRLAEHALHSWDILVAFDPEVEVESRAAELLVDLYPRDIISMLAALQTKGRFGTALLEVDIADPRRTLLMQFGESVTLSTADEAGGQAATGHLSMPTPGAWARLLTGRLDPEHTPPGVTSAGRPTLPDLRAALQGDPLAAADAESPP